MWCFRTGTGSKSLSSLTAWREPVSCLLPAGPSQILVPPWGNVCLSARLSSPSTAWLDWPAMAEVSLSRPLGFRRPVTPRPWSTWLRWSLWPAMLVGGIAAESFIWRAGQSPQYVVYDLGVGFLAVYVTLAIWEAKPSN